VSEGNQTSKAHASFGERGPFFTFELKNAFEGLQWRHCWFLAIAAAGAAGMLTPAARLVAALVYVVRLVSLVALLAAAALLSWILLASAALLGGILCAACTAAGTLSLLWVLCVRH